MGYNAMNIESSEGPMRARLCGIAICIATYVSTPTLAFDRLDCTYTRLDGSSNWPGHATIEIHSDYLEWKTDPIEVSDPKISIPTASFRYQILENNEVGIVAVLPEATNDKPLGLIVRATVIALTKANMNVRMGSVGTYPAHDLLTGPCRPK
jgi:hypothetical protein